MVFENSKEEIIVDFLKNLKVLRSLLWRLRSNIKRIIVQIRIVDSYNKIDFWFGDWSEKKREIMASVNYNPSNLDIRNNSADMYYEPNIPFYTQMCANNSQPIERMYLKNCCFNSIHSISRRSAICSFLITKNKNLEGEKFIICLLQW